MTAIATRSHPDPALYKVADLVHMLRMSRSEIYEQIRARRLLTVKQGRATFVTADDLTAYVALLKAEAEAAR